MNKKKRKYYKGPKTPLQKAFLQVQERHCLSHFDEAKVDEDALFQF